MPHCQNHTSRKTVAMTELPIYRLFDIPWVYQLSQLILVPGARSHLTAIIGAQLSSMPKSDVLLDVGSGPHSWVWWFDMTPIGVDISRSYLPKYRDHGGKAVNASALELPFKNEMLDGVWSSGLLHHLPDADATAAVKEMIRVTRPTGYVLIFDSVMPEHALRHPFAWATRRLDRGRHVRAEQRLRGVLPDASLWACSRVTYTYAGHEGLVCLFRK
jgi:SAM-dependent methyltransferase